MNALQTSREHVESAIEQLITLLDRMDSDCDLEDCSEDECNLEGATTDRELDRSDDEPYLGSWGSTTGIVDAEYDAGEADGPGLIAGGQGL